MSFRHAVRLRHMSKALRKEGLSTTFATIARFSGDTTTTTERYAYFDGPGSTTNTPNEQNAHATHEARVIALEQEMRLIRESNKRLHEQIAGYNSRSTGPSETKPQSAQHRSTQVRGKSFRIPYSVGIGAYLRNRLRKQIVDGKKLDKVTVEIERLRMSAERRSWAWTTLSALAWLSAVTWALFADWSFDSRTKTSERMTLARMEAELVKVNEELADYKARTGRRKKEGNCSGPIDGDMTRHSDPPAARKH